jgi:signal transduction histidine kinase/ActR/RegA family two-component response regulator
MPISEELSMNTAATENESAALTLEEIQLMGVFQAMDAAVLLKPDNNSVCNAKFDEIMPGWREVFTAGRPIEDVKAFFAKFTENPEDHIITIGKLRETRESQETIWRFKNGKTYSIRGFVVSLDERGDEYAELWILRDITEIDAQIRIFNSIFEMMDDPAFLILPDRPPVGNSAYDEAFPGWRDVYGDCKDIERGITEYWAKIVYNIDEVREQIAALRKTHELQETIWYFKNGRKRQFKATAVELSGEKIAELWISRDVTELINTKRLFNEIFNVMDPAVAVLNDGSFISNNAYNEFFADWERKYNDAISGDDEKDFGTLTGYWDSMITNADEHIEVIKKIRATHEPQTSLWHFRDGKECLQKGYWLDLGDRGGELWVLNDVSDLYDAIKRANEANLAKTAFLSSMSHEIRTPMNAIIGMTTLARSTNDIDRIHIYLEKTEEAGHRLMTLINDVLDMSKIESGKLEISENEFDFAKMLKTAVNVVSDRALEKRIEIKTHYKTPIKRFMFADELRMSQVIVNLLSNAVKFTPDLGTITLSTEITDGNLLRFSCSDTGIGVSDEAKAKLFHSFEQADKSITRRFGGTGLGLDICKQIVELMGGKIELISAEGEGATFTFEIPIEWRGALKGDDDCESGENSDNAETAFEGKRILLVEDVEVNRMIVAALLEGSAAVIDEAENGAEALELAKKNTYDIVLMDIQMPVMDGLTATRELRKSGAKMPIVAMTANAFKEDAEACIAAGMDAHIAKPIDPPAFMALLSDKLKGK